jgi:hypothetical protein
LKPIALFCLFCFFAICSGAQQNYWQQELNYKIEVTLNDKEHTLEGFMDLLYTNHSPDTLSFIWFHLWPNAFKNDRTAFSEQQLENGRTDFYFSGREQKGYINRLDFRVQNLTLKVEDHPQYSDIVKVYLPSPLAPGRQTRITTPFHVKLPDNFSRGGHNGKDGQSYQVTQWYPKPAVYDQKGWHPIPYLQQGEFYSEFGSYDVRISVPSNYVVAATGVLQNEDELQWLKKRGAPPKIAGPRKKGFGTPPVKSKTTKKTAEEEPATSIVSSTGFKTLRYLQDKVHDFAWFADKYFGVQYDTILLASGKKVDIFSYYHEPVAETWKNSTRFIGDAIRFRSEQIGEYPYSVISVVETKMGFEGGMEYPTITSVSPVSSEKELDLLMEHEIGHNWFYGILASNERDHPWMDEGMNSFYDYRYSESRYTDSGSSWLGNMSSRQLADLSVYSLEQLREDKPIATASPEFTETGYFSIAYGKAAAWMKKLEQELGKQQFDQAMQQYYEEWKFRHPYPEDFRKVMETTSGKDLSHVFSLLNKTGPMDSIGRKKLSAGFIFGKFNTEKMNSVLVSPAFGYNKYDGFMAGLLFHNLNLAPTRFRFVVAPMYATNSKTFSGAGWAGYSWIPDRKVKKIQLCLSAARFSYLNGTDSNGAKISAGFHKFVPALKIVFKNRYARSNMEKWLEWKTFLIGEESFTYSIKESDGQFYPRKGKTTNRYLNQLSFNIAQYSALYPYDVQLQAQQGDGFYRFNLTGYYFFNYSKGGGLQLRLFAAKFGYLGERTATKEFETERYQPKLTAVRGDEDYTYSNYFIGRNEQDGLGGQQIMMRDGGLKLRTDLFQDLQGRSDDWIASMNLNTSIPKNILPIPIPLKLFLDVGTYAEAWKNGSATSRFLFVGGVQLSLFKDILNIYAPLVYSKEFRDHLKTVPEENKFGKKISFSIDIHRFNFRRFTNNKLPL